MVVQGSRGRIAGGYGLIVSAGPVAVDAEHSSDGNAQERGIAAAGRRQFDKIDHAGDSAGARQRVLTCKILLKAQRQVDSAPIKYVKGLAWPDAVNCRVPRPVPGLAASMANVALVNVLPLPICVTDPVLLS